MEEKCNIPDTEECPINLEEHFLRCKLRVEQIVNGFSEELKNMESRVDRLEASQSHLLSSQDRIEDSLKTQKNFNDFVANKIREIWEAISTSNDKRDSYHAEQLEAISSLEKYMRAIAKDTDSNTSFIETFKRNRQKIIWWGSGALAVLSLMYWAVSNGYLVVVVGTAG
jgi:hypothetical protein